MKALINWSGGKDCTLALHHILRQKQLDVKFLFTTISREFQRVSMHGVRKELITRQAQCIGIPSRKLYLPENPDMPLYDRFMKHELELMKLRGITEAICGDIFLEDLRQYREDKLQAVGMSAHFPLWKRDTMELMKEFIDLGYKALIVSVNHQHLDSSFLGRPLDGSLLNDLPKGIDPCGENGEYHSFVYDGPIFTDRVAITKGETVTKTYTHNSQEFSYGFLDLGYL